jgi:PAS domain S-box-containing protein
MSSPFGNISISELIRHITRILLSENDIDKGINTSLEVLQRSTQVDRVYLCEMWINEVRGAMARQLFEYCALGSTLEFDGLMSADVQMDKHYSRWVEAFNRGSWISGHLDQFPPTEQQLMAGTGIQSMLVIPIKVENKLVGFIGFDSISTQRDWIPNDIELLMESSVLIGSLMVRRKQDARFKAEELNYSKLFGSMSDGVVYHDERGKIVHFNQAACDILGLTGDQLIGKTSLDKNWRSIHEDGTEYVGEDHPAMVTLRTRKPVDGVTMGVFDPSKQKYRWISIISIPHIDEHTGKMNGVFAIFRDISTRIQYQQELKKAKQVAEEVSRLKSNIMANIGHEFRTPLTGILGFARQIVEQSDQPKIQDAAQLIESSAHRLHHTLESLLEYSYLDRNVVEFRPKLVAMSEALRSILADAHQQARTKNLKFTYTLKGDEWVFCDERYITIIVRHLLHNAIKFTAVGQVSFELDVTDTQFSFRVQDTGIGIPESNYSYLFEPFSQASDGIGRSYEGSGLGLFIVKRLVERLHGTISIQSDSGTGTNFTVTLPREHTTDLHEPNLVEPEHANKSTAILYIEDNLVLRKLTRSMLSEYNLTTVATAEEALEFVEDRSFGLYLVDINLGSGMNGIELSRIIKAHPSYDGSPIAAVTAYSLNQLHEYGASSLFDHYLSKPFSQEELLTLVHATIGISEKVEKV